MLKEVNERGRMCCFVIGRGWWKPRTTLIFLSAKQAIAAQIVAVGDAVRALKAAKASKDEIMAKV